MSINSLAKGLTQSLTELAAAAAGPLGDGVVRLGVTGLSRAGKTVFITSLVANLLDRGRMVQLAAASGHRIRAAYLQPQPDDTVPRFPFEDHLSRLTSPAPNWPEGTRAISELRLSFRVEPQGYFGAMTGPRTVHLDIVDYPGEWLLDLSLLSKGFEAWSTDALARLRNRPGSKAYLDLLAATDPGQPIDEMRAQALAAAYTQALQAAREAGYSDCTPGRFLLPGELEGSPVLTFAPLPIGQGWPKGSLGAEFARRYMAYRKQVVTPFFRDHFARIDRQVVLVDVLGAIHAGPRAVEDLRRTLAEVMVAFRHGRNDLLSRLVGARRIDRILFAATKADHLHHDQHPRLAAITEALLREARDRAQFAGAETRAMSIAALRTTVEDEVDHEGQRLKVVRGRLEQSGKQGAFWAGELPDDPARLLSPARAGEERWLDGDYGVMQFAPAALTLRPGEGPPHIRLDRAAEFLIGDRL